MAKGLSTGPQVTIALYLVLFLVATLPVDAYPGPGPSPIARGLLAHIVVAFGGVDIACVPL